MRVDRKSLAVALIMLVKNNPINTPRVFHVETVVYFKVSITEKFFLKTLFSKDVAMMSQLGQNYKHFLFLVPTFKFRP